MSWEHVAQGHWETKILFQLVKCMGHGAYNFDVQFFAHFRDVVVANTRERLRVFFERQARCVPFFKQYRQLLCRLSSNDEKSWVQTTKTFIKILEALKKKPGKQELSVAWWHFIGASAREGSERFRRLSHVSKEKRASCFNFVGSRVTTLCATLSAAFTRDRFVKNL